MPLVAAQCTNCGANLSVDSTKDAAICSYCGSAFIIEKAINNYNITNNIRANVVNIYGTNSDDFRIRAGVLMKYNGASVDVVIPNTVKAIGYQSFDDCEFIRNIVIPSSVEKIEAFAFNYCKRLKNIVIPKSVTLIENGAFNGCSNLENMVFSNQDILLTSIDSSYNFYKKSLRNMYVEEIIRGLFADGTLVDYNSINNNLKINDLEIMKLIYQRKKKREEEKYLKREKEEQLQLKKKKRWWE